MRREVTSKTRSLAGASDLTLFAPIKPGLVPSLESVTYKTRTKRLLRTLTALRAGSHESALLRPFSDAVERVGRIHSVRVAVIEPEDKILLAVTFDGDWESYIRVLWQKVGGLLDVIFCNTVDYVSACDHSFADWLVWAKRIQTESAFFYAAPHTVDDIPSLKREELLQRMTDQAVQSLYSPGVDRALLATRASFLGAEAEAELQRTAPNTKLEVFSQGFLALSGLYRLADLFVPGAADGVHLQRASRELLVEFRDVIKPGLPPEAEKRFARQLTWLRELDTAPSVRPVPQLQAPNYDHSNVQGGIVTAYDRVTHGAMLLMSFDTPGAGASFLEKLLPHVTYDGVQPMKTGKIVTNVALTFEGLRALGLSDAQLDYFPQEFREGMEARASILGDLRTNHPRRWRLPMRVDAKLKSIPGSSVELSTVHLIVQLRINANIESPVDDLSQPEHPLHARIKEIVALEPAARLLAMQPMRRHMEKHKESGEEKIREHFGFFDGEGQPLLGPQTGAKYYPNGIHLGEVLLGHSNEADPAPAPATDPVGRERQTLLFDGSYLVIRKLRQDVPGLHAKTDQAAATNGMESKDVLAKMVGRKLDGEAIVKPVGTSANDFDYRQDTQGSQCPFHAHIRRANPRTPANPQAPFGARTPRIMRRGMSYGPRYDFGNPTSATSLAERGLMFMAYNSSIDEQFEVVQRWLAGGNSSGGLSFHSDPLLGVPENGKQRFYRFEHDNKVVRMELDGSPALLADPKPFVKLEWGLYSFAPSLRALRKLKDIAANVRGIAPVWSVEDGERQIGVLRKLESAGDDRATIAAWKSALEDPDAQERFASASLWAAIRDRHQGALRTPYGVLVADRTLAMQVLRDTSGRYTANGYSQRMATSIGAIYLGLDRQAPGGRYDVESAATNDAIQKLDEQVEFNRTYRYTQALLQKIFDKERDDARARGEKFWVLQLDIKEVSDRVLAMLCQYWFGLPEDDKKGPYETGASRWDWQCKDKPLYPGNFTAPSRYIFQPRPGDMVEQYGNLYGQTLTDAMQKFIAPYCSSQTVPPDPKGSPAPITAAILDAHKAKQLSVTQVAQNIVGAMMGFLPTVDGNLRRALNEWLIDQTFWRLRGRLPSMPGDPYVKADALLRGPLMRTMQLRPSPELVWRTAARHHDLGPVAVETGDLIVVSIVSATQQCLQHQITDVFPIFGGDRSKPDHPTHACPAYKAAMGVLLGIVTALLEISPAVRPGPAPLVLTVTGPT